MTASCAYPPLLERRRAVSSLASGPLDGDGVPEAVSSLAASPAQRSVLAVAWGALLAGEVVSLSARAWAEVTGLPRSTVGGAVQALVDRGILRARLRGRGRELALDALAVARCGELTRAIRPLTTDTEPES